MRYLKRVSLINMLGEIWWPYRATCAQKRNLSDYDLENIKDRIEPGYTRRNVEHWMGCNTGDFSKLLDFSVTISDSEGVDFDSEWEKGEESEFEFNDLMYPGEE